MGRGIGRISRMALSVAGLLALTLSGILGGCGAEKTALDKARKAAERSPKSEEAQVAYGKALVEADQFNDAYAAFRRANELDPKDVETLCELAKVSLQLGDSDRAAKFVNQALALDPGDAASLDILGRIYILTERPKDAIKTLEKAVAADPKLADARIDLIYAQLQAGDAKGAAQTAKAGVEVLPNDAKLHYAYGDVLMLVKKSKEAEAQFRRALKLDPKHNTAMMRIATILIQQKRGYDEARKLAQKAAEIDDGDGRPAATAAWALLKMGQQADALNELYIVSRAHPYNHHILMMFADALHQAGDEKNARLVMNEALKVAPRVPLSPAQKAKLQETMKAGKKGGKVDMGQVLRMDEPGGGLPAPGRASERTNN